MNKEIISAKEILRGTGLSVLDCARLIKNILDARGAGGANSAEMLRHCAKVITTGLRHVRDKEMSFAQGFAIYREAKKHLRPDSIRDIRCIGNRLMRSNPRLAARNFSELSTADCEELLNLSFGTPSQFNKARAMLHGLFAFALRREWCDANPVKKIERKKVIEKEIAPLTIAQTRRLIEAAKAFPRCAAPAGLLVYAGIRPREVRRLAWRDIDLAENTITIRPQCSKTGGTRQVEICPALKRLLGVGDGGDSTQVCPRNWNSRWRDIRQNAGLKSGWQQDVLRHTYASYHAKRYADLPQLQLNMGHRDQSLLRSRYVNMRGISRLAAAAFFN